MALGDICPFNADKFLRLICRPFRITIPRTESILPKFGNWNLFRCFASRYACFLASWKFPDQFFLKKQKPKKQNKKLGIHGTWNPNQLLGSSGILFCALERSLLSLQNIPYIGIDGKKKVHWDDAHYFDLKWRSCSSTPSWSRISVSAKTNVEHLSAYKSSIILMHPTICIPLVQSAQMRNFRTECRRWQKTLLSGGSHDHELISILISLSVWF